MASACALFCTKEKITHLRPTKQSHAIPCYSICTCMCCHMPYAGPAYRDLSRPGVLRSLKEFSSELMHGEQGPWGFLSSAFGLQIFVWWVMWRNSQLSPLLLAWFLIISHHFSSCLPFLMVSHHFSSLVGGFKHEFYFPFHIWDVILPIDELHHFSRWLKHVKTTKQILFSPFQICFEYPPVI